MRQVDDNLDSYVDLEFVQFTQKGPSHTERERTLESLEYQKCSSEQISRFVGSSLTDTKLETLELAE